MYRRFRTDLAAEQRELTAGAGELKGVRVMAVTMDKRPLKQVYEPGHPDANAEGYVSYPDINVVEEIANLMSAQRNYEANVTTVEAIKGMYNKALEIGKS